MITINQFTIIGTIVFISGLVLFYLFTRKKSKQVAALCEPLEHWIENKVDYYTMQFPNNDTYYFNAFAQGYTENDFFPASDYLVNKGFNFYYDEKRGEISIIVPEQTKQRIKSKYIEKVAKEILFSKNQKAVV